MPTDERRRDLVLEWIDLAVLAGWAVAVWFLGWRSYVVYAFAAVALVMSVWRWRRRRRSKSVKSGSAD